MKADSLCRMRVAKVSSSKMSCPATKSPSGYFWIRSVASFSASTATSMPVENVLSAGSPSQAAYRTYLSSACWVRLSSSCTSAMPLKLPESMTATEQKTTPLKCPGNMRSSVSSAWRPRPPYPPTKSTATGESTSIFDGTASARRGWRARQLGLSFAPRADRPARCRDGGWRRPRWRSAAGSRSTRSRGCP